MLGKFILLVGLPGSGKSTWAKKVEPNKSDLVFGKIKIYSSDEYRKKMFGDEKDQNHNKEVFEAIYKDIEEEADLYNVAILDATNITRKDRARAIQVARRISKKCSYPLSILAYVFSTSLEECIARDKSRERQVGEKIIRGIASRFEFPSTEEGIDDIRIGNYSALRREGTPPYQEAYDYLVGNVIYSRMIGFNQNNPHHQLTLDQHCLKLARLAYENGEDINMQIAGLLHDIGKVDTQTEDENGVSHYYNHENYSVIRAVKILVDANLLSLKYNAYKILFLIQNHMKIRSIKNSPKSTSKHIAKWGQGWFDDLVRFSEYDEKASI